MAKITNLTSSQIKADTLTLSKEDLSVLRQHTGSQMTPPFGEIVDTGHVTKNRPGSEAGLKSVCWIFERHVRPSELAVRFLQQEKPWDIVVGESGKLSRITHKDLAASVTQSFARSVAITDADAGDLAALSALIKNLKNGAFKQTQTSAGKKVLAVGASERQSTTHDVRLNRNDFPQRGHKTGSGRGNSSKKFTKSSLTTRR